MNAPAMRPVGVLMPDGDGGWYARINHSRTLSRQLGQPKGWQLANPFFPTLGAAIAKLEAEGLVVEGLVVLVATRRKRSHQ